jgi:poly(U)-specific endoribonuclease
MDAKVEQFYRSIYGDLTVDQEETSKLEDFFAKLNPPPDKLVWLRSTAFKIGCECLSDDHDKNVALLRAVNVIVHSLEQTCMT